ncbi:MAG: amidohydrolase family protein [Limisphaerales bacterium]
MNHPALRHLFLAAAIKLAATPLLGADSLAITNATLHTVVGPVMTNAAILVRGGRITALGHAGIGPADVTVDATGLHLFPGLIAPVAALGLLEIDAVRATRDTTEVGAFTPDVYAWVAVNPDSELIPVARANGFTHAQPVPQGGVVSGHSAVIALDGWTVEEVAVRRAAALHVVWPSFVLNTAPRGAAANPENWKSPDEQAKERDRRVKAIDDFFQDAEAYARAKVAEGESFTIVPAWEAMLPALRGEVPLFLHADEQRQIRSAVGWAARRKYRAVLAGGRDAWRCAELLATNQVPVVFEHVFTQPARDEDPYDVHFAAPAILFRAGVRVAFSDGTDRFGASNIRNLPYAAAHAAAFGLPADEALRGLTLHPAHALGVADRLGSLEPGKEASFFLADGDILDIRTQVRRMWISGNEVSLESRHTRLHERYRRRPKAP